ncbi:MULTISPECIES: hypothetical protein [unclassified Paenibacillus]|nr:MULTISPECIES: hypothetical protein [unclassified Paenibacillus]MDQ0896210.1 hypothetical protein [Paenibacillus sp. V4I7]MDQ0913974.1 hypothetical protein [Paenibacillus sp. V4I5]
MTKLLVTLLVCALLMGVSMYVFGSQILPATGTAGTTQRTNIQNAFN